MKPLIKDLLSNALKDLSYPDNKVILEIPKNTKHGDIATNIAMTISKSVGKNPREIAENIVSQLKSNNDSTFQEITIAGPGFINFKLNPKIYLEQIKTIIENENYGKSNIGKNKKALVEFVSANPTGPLTVGHGRGAVLGDTISNILEWNGFMVKREYYFNNAGRQMRLLGESVKSRYLESCGETLNFPEDGYQGEYIQDIASELYKQHNKSKKNESSEVFFKDVAEKSVFNTIKSSLKKIGLEFDSFFNEDDLYESGAIDDVIKDLRQKKIIYEKDNAIWFNSEKIGREQDKVLIKSSGEPTYRLPDVAYHKNKFKRGFDRIIDIFGADHADTWPDVLALVGELGCDTDRVTVLIHQFVTLTEGGEKVKMSTRKANFITLDELCDDIGPDVLRYFFIMRGINSHLNFDLNLAKNQSDENPVFYLQYAHARICNIIKRANGFGHEINLKANLDLLDTEIEQLLIRKIIQFPELVENAGNLLEPQLIANYLQDLCTIFHKFYVLNKVISDDLNMTAARLVLTETSRITIKNGLTILGISTPERM